MQYLLIFKDLKTILKSVVPAKFCGFTKISELQFL